MTAACRAYRIFPVIAFDKERLPNAVEIEIFGLLFIDTNLVPPKNYSG